MKALQMSVQDVSHKQTSSGSNGIAGPIVPAKGVTDAVEVGARTGPIVPSEVDGAAVTSSLASVERIVASPLVFGPRMPLRGPFTGFDAPPSRT
jgi:hypothetical protein